jgi:regulator of sigma E protease
MAFSELAAFIGKGLPIAYSLIGFGLLIAVHELGHFLFCKIFSIHTPTFSIGFGPELYKRKIGQTNFRIAAIPFGGYVEIAGLAEVGQGGQEHADDTSAFSFTNKPFWQKALVLLGGIMFNVLFAYFSFCIIFIAGNRSTQPAVSVMSIVAGSAAEKAGLKEQDLIIGINESILSTNPITLNDEIASILLPQIQANPNKTITLTIKRDQKEFTLPITLNSRKENGATIGVIGAAFQPPSLPFWYSIRAGFDYTRKAIGIMYQSIKTLLTNRSLEGAAGPVMIIAQGAATAKHGFIPLLHFLGILSLSLALMNLLPFGALDGGQLLFTTIEFIIRRRIPEIIKLIINLASWIFLLSLMAYFTYREIGALFGNTFNCWWIKILGFFK